jgi:nucleotide-binding universal stress UspA family protein
MYRHILIPTDGSELAGRAVRHGLSLAKSLGAKVTALTVEASFDVYTVPASKVYAMSGAFAEHAERVKAHAQRILNDVAEQARAAGVAARRCKSRKTILTKPSSRPPSRGVAISSSWPRTDAVALRPSCSVA